MRRLLLLFAAVLFAIFVANDPRDYSSGAAATPSSSIRAQVVGQTAGATGVVPIPGAVIDVQGLGLRASTDAQGQADISNIAISANASKVQTVDVVISAPKYGSFTYKSLPLYPNDQAILTPVLKVTPQVDDLGQPVPPVRPASTSAAVASPQVVTAGCSGWSSTNTMPNVIKVYHNGPFNPDNLIHTVDFHSYAQHVLPREWMPSWNQEALRAGAMAVKMYAWYWMLNWRGGSVGGNCYDVDSSTNYQVWDPAYSQQSTSQAVDDTWDYFLMYLSNGTPNNTGYASGFSTDACGQDAGHPASGSHMSQWGSQACALAGKVWYDILLNWYYFNPASTLKNGPVETQSSNEGLPVLLPSTTPWSNSQVTITWGSTSGVDYYLCYDAFLGIFNGTCPFLGTGVSSTFQNIPTGDGGEVYYRLKACKNGYCSALRAGGVKNRTPSGNNFFGTASYTWFYASAKVASRNYSSSTHAVKLYDGVPGFGGVLKTSCNSAPSTTCGPSSWGLSAVSWYVTTTQQASVTDNAPIRLVPQGNGE